MRLSNGEVLLRWPLSQHIITAGWTYSEVGDDGEFVRQNVKKNYIATAEDTLAAIATLKADAMQHIDGGETK